MNKKTRADRKIPRTKSMVSDRKGRRNSLINRPLSTIMNSSSKQQTMSVNLVNSPLVNHNNTRVRRMLFEKQSTAQTTPGARPTPVNTEQNELASVFARLALGRRNTIVGGAPLVVSSSGLLRPPSKLPLGKNSIWENEAAAAPTPLAWQQVPHNSNATIAESESDSTLSFSSSTLDLNTDNDSVFMRSDSFSSLATVASGWGGGGGGEVCRSSSQSTVLPASTDLENAERSDDSIKSTDTLKSSLDSFGKIEKEDEEAAAVAATMMDEDASITVNGVSKLGRTSEVISKIDQVIRDLDGNATGTTAVSKMTDQTLTEVSALNGFIDSNDTNNNNDSSTSDKNNKSDSDEGYNSHCKAPIYI
jgi:hypothetical protein